MAALERDPICPHCEKPIEEPRVREYRDDVKAVYCPHCQKILGVLPISQFVYQ